MGTDGKYSHVSLRTNQKLQETFRLSPSFQVSPSFLVGAMRQKQDAANPSDLGLVLFGRREG
jgi:hypothetical protein